MHPGQGGRIAWPEHDVVDQQLRAPVEQFGQRLGALLGVERVLLLDRHPRQLGALLGDLLIEVASSCSRFSSSARAASYSSCVPTLWRVIADPSFRELGIREMPTRNPVFDLVFVPLQTEHAILFPSSDHGPRVR